MSFEKYISGIDISINENDALLIIDVQNDFLPGGALAVADGDQIIPGINELSRKFVDLNQVVFTQDWHPAGHLSFASSHLGKEPFDEYTGPGLGPLLWPDHCIQGSNGAEFAPNLDRSPGKLILRKGFRKHIDSYSGFLENDKQTETGLQDYLLANNVKRVFVCGLALDYCVKYTLLDSVKFGFNPHLILDLTKPVDSSPSNIKNLLNYFQSKGIKIIKSQQILF